jgi:uncharacterized spore protein YtfJ
MLARPERSILGSGPAPLGDIDPRSVTMTTETNTTESAARSAQPPRRRADELLSLLADRIGAQLASSTVYGAPVERDGVTVVPVSAARFGFGAGGGSDPDKRQEGEGGGGGGTIAPIGYIELKDGRSRFIPIVHPARMLALVGCTILAGLAILRPAIAPRRASVLPWR